MKPQIVSLTDLGDSAESILAAFVEQLIELGVDLPEASYVSPGEVAWDQPSVTIYLGVGDQGEPGQTLQGSFRVARAVHTSSSLFVQILRKTSSIGPLGPWTQIPAPADLNADGKLALKDAGCLMKAAIMVFKDYQAVGPGQSFTIGPVTTLGPQGGMAAVRLRIDVSLS